jgi:hypothetical protein
MRISRIQVIGMGMLLFVGLSVALRAQEQKSPSMEVRSKAINLVRMINTAEVTYKMSPNYGHGHYSTWTELYDSGLMKTGEVSPGPEVIPGFRLDLIVSPDGESFSLALHDTKDGDGLFSVFSDQSGIIYLGAPLQ